MAANEEREKDVTRERYKWFCDITTRWMDNDVYGHVNNVTYYSYFDTAANLYLIREGGLDIHSSDVIGVVVESRCAYRDAIAYPEPIRAGLAVGKLGNRSVTYEIGIFREGRDVAALSIRIATTGVMGPGSRFARPGRHRRVRPTPSPPPAPPPPPSPRTPGNRAR